MSDKFYAVNLSIIDSEAGYRAPICNDREDALTEFIKLNTELLEKEATEHGEMLVKEYTVSQVKPGSVLDMDNCREQFIESIMTALVKVHQDAEEDNPGYDFMELLKKHSSQIGPLAVFFAKAISVILTEDPEDPDRFPIVWVDSGKVAFTTQVGFRISADGELLVET